MHRSVWGSQVVVVQQHLGHLDHLLDMPVAVADVATRTLGPGGAGHPLGAAGIQDCRTDNSLALLVPIPEAQGSARVNVIVP